MTSITIEQAFMNGSPPIIAAMKQRKSGRTAGFVADAVRRP